MTDRRLGPCCLFTVHVPTSSLLLIPPLISLTPPPHPPGVATHLAGPIAAYLQSFPILIDGEVGGSDGGGETGGSELVIRRPRRVATGWL